MAAMDPELETILRAESFEDADLDTLKARGITSCRVLAFLADKPDRFRQDIGEIPPWRTGDRRFALLKAVWLKCWNKENRDELKKDEGLEGTLNDYEPLPGTTVQTIQQAWITKYGALLPDWQMPTVPVWSVLYRQLSQRRLAISPIALHHTVATATALPQGAKAYQIVPGTWQQHSDPDKDKPKKMYDSVNTAFLYMLSLIHI